MTQYAVIKTEGKNKGAAGIKPQSQHFTIFEKNITECGFINCSQAQITTCKPALCKSYI